LSRLVGRLLDDRLFLKVNNLKGKRSVSYSLTEKHSPEPDYKDSKLKNEDTMRTKPEVRRIDHQLYRQSSISPTLPAALRSIDHANTIMRGSSDTEYVNPPKPAGKERSYSLTDVPLTFHSEARRLCDYICLSRRDETPRRRWKLDARSPKNTGGAKSEEKVRPSIMLTGQGCGLLPFPLLCSLGRSVGYRMIW
jgi:hypothetical protein